MSALTLFGLHELAARHASYADLADIIRRRFVSRSDTLRELFLRIVVNILVGNTDDHARNHAAFYDPALDELSLTPAFDICPQIRSGGEASQAMAIGPDGQRLAKLSTCRDAAPVYDLTDADACELIDHAVDSIVASWDDAADAARLTTAQRQQMWGTRILSPYAFHGYGPQPR